MSVGSYFRASANIVGGQLDLTIAPALVGSSKGNLVKATDVVAVRNFSVTTALAQDPSGISSQGIMSVTGSGRIYMSTSANDTSTTQTSVYINSTSVTGTVSINSAATMSLAAGGNLSLSATGNTSTLSLIASGTTGTLNIDAGTVPTGALGTINIGTLAPASINIGTIAAGNFITIGNVSSSNNIYGPTTIHGNLIVSGSITQVSTQSLVVDDQYVVANAAPISGYDAGFLINRYRTDVAQLTDPGLYVTGSLSSNYTNAGGSSLTISLQGPGSWSAVNGFYNGWVVRLSDGTNTGIAVVSNYTAGTFTLTLDPSNGGPLSFGFSSTNTTVYLFASSYVGMYYSEAATELRCGYAGDLTSTLAPTILANVRANKIMPTSLNVQDPTGTTTYGAITSTSITHSGFLSIGGSATISGSVVQATASGVVVTLGNGSTSQFKYTDISGTTGTISLGTSVTMSSTGTGAFSGLVSAGSFSAGSGTLTGALTANSLSVTTSAFVSTLTVTSASALAAVVGIMGTLDATATNAASVILSGGIGVAKSAYIGSVLNVGGNTTLAAAVALTSTSTNTTVLSISGSQDATATNVAAVTLAGGLGIAKSVWIGSNLTVVGTSTHTGVINANGGIIASTLSLATLNLNSTSTNTTVFSVSGTEDASATNVASVTFAGGLGVAKSAYIGSILNVAGNATLAAAVALTSASTNTTVLSISGSQDASATNVASVTLLGGIGVSKSAYIGSILSVGGSATFASTVALTSASTNTTVLSVAGSQDATATNVASVTLLGGIGVAKSAYIGSILNVGGNTTLASSVALTSTSTNTTVLSVAGTYDASATNVASVIFAGGLGVAKQVFVGSTLTANSIAITNGGSISGGLNINAGDLLMNRTNSARIFPSWERLTSTATAVSAPGANIQQTVFDLTAATTSLSVSLPVPTSLPAGAVFARWISCIAIPTNITLTVTVASGYFVEATGVHPTKMIFDAPGQSAYFYYDSTTGLWAVIGSGVTLST